VEELVEEGLIDEDKAEELVDKVVEEVLEDEAQEATKEESCECQHLKMRRNGLEICWHGKWVDRKSLR
jgi:polyhydroxyalkanoate synthesis regulator phasin